MYIEREFGGTVYQIMLTSQEMLDAYYIQQNEFDKSDIEMVIEGLSNEEVMETYGISIDEFMSRVPAMAERKRYYENKDDVSWQTARDEAISDYCE